MKNVKYLTVATLVATCLSLISINATAAGPESDSVDASAYSTISYVDQATGDDIHGEGTKDKPWSSVVHALEHSGYATAGKRVAVLVSQGHFGGPTFTLRSHVDLYGGFKVPGGVRDVNKYPTILDGEGSRRILFGSDNARLDGFHLIGGRVRGKGAAILCDGVSPVIANCVFEDNRTLIPQPWQPKLLHETGHDGGAIMILNGAEPVIEQNYFYDNATECGRGGAVAIDLRGSPKLNRNVFANNIAGLHDPTRSSDGGAVSFFDWAGGEFIGNVIVANEAFANNDAGGVFIAMWAEPIVADNIFVANVSGDDAGGLFIGGQEHRYDAPLDEYPSAKDFNVKVENNIFVGNVNSSSNSGAMRITMESRVHFKGNLIAENKGGFYLQRSEMTVENNTIWQDWMFLEDKPSLGPSVFKGNILKGPAGDVEARVSFERNMMESTVPGSGTIPVKDVFVDDSLSGEIVSTRFDYANNTTIFETKKALPRKGDLVNRCVRISQDHDGGQWRVVKSAKGNQLVIWGHLRASTSNMEAFDILRTFTLRSDAPKGVGAGS